MSRSECLFVIIPDQLSALIKKGEVTPRYYNPGDSFREVHMILINDDRTGPDKVQPMVGSARLHLHNIPAGRSLFVKSAGWRPFLLRRWATAAVDLAWRYKPSVVRCHGNGLNAFAALSIKRSLGTPYVISLHGNPDVDYFRGRLGRTWQEKLIGRAIESVEIATIRNADMVLPVYSPIVPYLRKHCVKKYEVVFNSVGHCCEPKRNYAVDKNDVRILCVGRQQRDQKDPRHIIEACADIPGAHLTLIGDGELHDGLKDLARDLGVTERVKFMPHVQNSDVLAEMARTDIFAYSSINWEISKATLEAALCGLPIVLNDRNGNPADELRDDFLIMVQDTREGFRDALQSLISDPELRERLGRSARARAVRDWEPVKMESRVAHIYRSLMKDKSGLVA